MTPLSTAPTKDSELPAPNGRCRIAVTGGPGGGKTTAADLFRREMGARVAVVPEAGTMLFVGGFPRSTNPRARMAMQRAIYHVQRNLEDAQAALYPSRILLCDRGTVDGGAYWPGSAEDFFSAVGSTFDEELRRYDSVIFFESAATGGMSIEGGNAFRTETSTEAAALDARLRELWSRHPRFVLVPHNASFIKKITDGLAALLECAANFR